jgi:hypothetical protein
MQIHVVIGLNGEASVDALNVKVQKRYPGDRHYRLTGKPAWLVADDALARDVSRKLGITADEGGIAGLVTTIANYFGRANPEIWAWMQTMYERPMPELENVENSADAVAGGAEHVGEVAGAAW